MSARKKRAAAVANETMRTPAPNPAGVGTDGLTGWRRRRLEVAGFGHELAAALASDPRSDVHRLIELVEAGCPDHLAARILAPLEETTPQPPDASSQECRKGYR